MHITNGWLPRLGEILVHNFSVREVVRHFRQNDLKTVSYVDDSYVCDNKEIVESKNNWAIQELVKLCWHINFEKSCYNPKTECKFIGFLIRTAVDNDTVWLKIPKCRISEKSAQKGSSHSRSIG